MRKIVTGLALSTLCAGVWCIAQGAQRPASARGHSKKADVKGDGPVTSIEYYTIMSDVFDKADKNKDGKLSKEEMEAQLVDVLHAVDTNRDGIVARDEWVAYFNADQKAAGKKARPNKKD